MYPLSLIEWEQPQQDLESEKLLHNQTKIDLNTSEQDLNELLQKKDQALEYFRKDWKQANNELNKVLAQGQGFYQVTDNELIEKAKILRFNIRNFADQQFVGGSIDVKSSDSFSKSIEEHVGTSHDVIITCMKDSSRRLIIVRAYLWGTLTNDIFGKFHWAGTHVSKSMYRLEDILGKKSLVVSSWNDFDLKMPLAPFADDTDFEAKRKFQMWRANKTTLLLDSMKFDQAYDHESHRKWVKEKVRDIYELLGPFSKSKGKDLKDQLFRLVDEALDLDKVISKQVAEVIWDFGLQKRSGQFNQGLMELQQSNQQTSDCENVLLVSAPAMIKRGKSTGKDFDVENILLEMEASWEPRTIEHVGGSHKLLSLIQRALRFPGIFERGPNHLTERGRQPGCEMGSEVSRYQQRWR